jgi:hypothetical protein
MCEESSKVALPSRLDGGTSRREPSISRKVMGLISAPSPSGEKDYVITLAIANHGPSPSGEHCLTIPARSQNSGSPPRTRGTLATDEPPLHRRRLIPAHAGNTPRPTGRMACKPDHPRTRGEHVSLYGTTIPRGGSSPRTRGTPDVFRQPDPGVRFIPAHAVNTSPRCSTEIRATAHPRTRGEHCNGSGITYVQDGRSPSREHSLRPAVTLSGIASSPRTRGTHSKVHLRPTIIRSSLTRGEHFREQLDRPHPPGSSPRTRRTRVAFTLRRLFQRFITACAENTSSSPPATRGGSVYPCARR